ncbi:MAG: undecaprenyl-phosphate galactose phosphotransferase WbaP, partial [Planctomycetota bacterium]
GIVFVPLGRMMARKMLVNCRWWGERAVIIGAGPQGRTLYEYYRRAAQRGLRPIGLVDSDSHHQHRERFETYDDRAYLGSVNELPRLAADHGIRWGIISPGGCRDADLGQVLAQASVLPNTLLLPSQFLLPSLWASTHDCAGMMGVHMRDNLQNPLAAFVKRSMDIVLSLVGLVLLSPLFALIMLLVKLNSPGDCFFGHTRIGKGERPFKAWKFRSMVQDADKVLDEYLNDNPELRQQWFENQKLNEDPRIIPVIGNFLRRTSLDELPQLWNVLVGDMSLVGPRPIVENEIKRYGKMYPLYLRVTPGITGLWQISGRNDTSYDQRVKLDSYYVSNWSIWLDIYITLRTIRTVILREGAY